MRKSRPLGAIVTAVLVLAGACAGDGEQATHTPVPDAASDLSDEPDADPCAWFPPEAACGPFEPCPCECPDGRRGYREWCFADFVHPFCSPTGFNCLGAPCVCVDAGWDWDANPWDGSFAWDVEQEDVTTDAPAGDASAGVDADADADASDSNAEAPEAG
jgi:hypothetical protein